MRDDYKMYFWTDGIVIFLDKHIKNCHCSTNLLNQSFEMNRTTIEELCRRDKISRNDIRLEFERMEIEVFKISEEGDDWGYSHSID